MLPDKNGGVLWKLWFDGLCEPVNPGGGLGMGYHLVMHNGQERSSGYALHPAPENTNNQAEYMALMSGLTAVTELARLNAKPDQLEIYGDSMLVINQLNGRWQCKSPVMAGLRDECLKELAKVWSDRWWSATWIPRDQNERADAVSRRVYTELTGRQAPERHPMLRTGADLQRDIANRRERTIRRPHQGQFPYAKGR
ncbi:MAG TPA: ribonuclease HI family protein [Tepidisphaeraceae bacterium]|jgi:ribonuclease HI|nr:ribonuclease HI family protein [Tepidisphaeraceae bacterium]